MLQASAHAIGVIFGPGFFRIGHFCTIGPVKIGRVEFGTIFAWISPVVASCLLCAAFEQGLAMASSGALGPRRQQGIL